MEDQGERSPQTFLVNNSSFPQPQRKQGDRCAFKRVWNTDSGFKHPSVTDLVEPDLVSYFSLHGGILTSLAPGSFLKTPW